MAVLSEVGFGMDNFNQPLKLNQKDSIVQVLLNMLFLKPGNYPSMPHIGIDIQKYLYKTANDIDSEGLKEQIFNQCAEIMSDISIGDIQIAVVDIGGGSSSGTLVIVIPLITTDDNSKETNMLVLGFQSSETGKVLYNYKFTDADAFV